jgi:hypothetical protein
MAIAASPKGVRSVHIHRNLLLRSVDLWVLASDAKQLII